MFFDWDIFTSITKKTLWEKAWKSGPKEGLYKKSSKIAKTVYESYTYPNKQKHRTAL